MKRTLCKAMELRRNGGRRHVRREVGGITVDAGGDGGEGDCLDAMGQCDLDRAPVATCQQAGLALVSAAPYRPHRVDDMASGKRVSAGDFCLAGRAAIQAPAFGKQFRTCRPVDGTVDAAPPSRVELAALTIASTSSRVIAPTITAMPPRPTRIMAMPLRLSRRGHSPPGEHADQMRAIVGAGMNVAVER